MSQPFEDLGYAREERPTPLLLALRANPDLVAICKKRGWFAKTIAMLEREKER